MKGSSRSGSTRSYRGGSDGTGERKKRTVSDGEPPYWAEDFESVGGRIDPDGTVLLYHATTPEKAGKILAEGILRSPPGAPDTYGVYLGSSESVSRDYGGGTVVPVRVRVRDLHLDDLYPGDRADFRINTRKNRYRPVAVGKAALRTKTDGRRSEREWTVTKESSLREWADEVLDEAKNHFGLTDDHREAGYVLPNGTMLDFNSGSHRKDHREISFAFPEDIELPEEITKYDRPGVSNEIENFERLTDSIRVFLWGTRSNGYSLNVQLNTFQDLSDAQWNTLTDAAIWANIDSVEYDLYNRDGILFGSKYRPNLMAEDPEKLIRKLRRHFEKVQRQEVRDRWTEEHGEREAE